MLSMAGMGILMHRRHDHCHRRPSARTASIATDSIAVEWIIIAGMIVGSLPFALSGYGSWLETASAGSTSALVPGLLGSVVAVLIWHLSSNGMPVAVAIRQASFNTVSIMTGTGYGSANFSAWGGFASTLLLIGMFVGGCGGSTTCGIKVFRLQVLATTARVQIGRLLRPHAVILAYYNRRQSRMRLWIQ